MNKILFKALKEERSIIPFFSIIKECKNSGNNMKLAIGPLVNNPRIKNGRNK